MDPAIPNSASLRERPGQARVDALIAEAQWHYLGFLGEQHGVAKSDVEIMRRFHHQYGFFRPPVNWCHAAIVEMLAQNWTYEAIGRRLETTAQTVHTYAKTTGIRPVRKSGRAPKAPKGPDC